MISIAHVSDLHLDDSPRATERAERVMSYLRDLPGPLDAVLVTGDIADHAAPQEYQQAKELFALPYPVLVLPGNHDRRAPFRTGLLDGKPDDEELNQVVRTKGATFLLCDSTIPDRDEGLISDRSLAWLDGALSAEADDRPVFVCFHHPPVTLHTPYVDRLRQFQEARLAEVLVRHPQVVALLCGHAHTAAATTFAGLPLLVAPGVASTVPLPFEGRDTVDHELAPGLAFHVLDDRRRLVTHYRALS
ncbi:MULTISPECIES: metallophosphoesterase [Streptomyces]|uniref:3',5'-cyclic adenosine monophosphate phosphodiesterase CpdA n=1 Tax=Streptomyces xanthochromogenes TaxID=67384 RepID=A0ABQ2ZMQ6_9ACTN|nr:metallophosphoesterase [Streptomyces xanthochromogenes]MYV95712.1 phosphodiesterase [Streptomyces sp. SID1034]GGY18191.1 3',5'-cyclic adenosine monophosphate phosphodiesterase CpdA [Streptomyces xanthochromogenes]